MTKEAKYPVQTTNRSLDIVEILKDQGPLGVSETAEKLDMSKSIVHNHLSTLEERGYVLSEDGIYQLSFRFLEIGGFCRKQRNLYSGGRPEIEKLAAKTGEMASLVTEERGWCVYLFQASGDDAVKLKVNYEGMYEHMHSTSLGKVMLAHFSKDKVIEIIDHHGLPKHTENTITEREELLERLEAIRERGYSVDDEESIPGLRCVAAAIKRGDEDVVGSVSVSGPISRIKGGQWEVELPEQVQSAANVIEINTQYSEGHSIY